MLGMGGNEPCAERRGGDWASQKAEGRAGQEGGACILDITRRSAGLQPNAEETAAGRKDAQTADIKGMVGHIKGFRIYPKDRKFKQTTARHSSVFLQCTT